MVDTGKVVEVDMVSEKLVPASIMILGKNVRKWMSTATDW